MEIATSMIAFSTFLGVLFAMIYYIYQNDIPHISIYKFFSNMSKRVIALFD